MNIIFVGGDERQRQITTKLKAKLLRDGLDVAFLHPGFVRNWNKPLAEVRRMLPEADAVVVTTDVPTLLGREIRRSARSAGVYGITMWARGEARILQVVHEAAKGAMEAGASKAA